MNVLDVCSGISAPSVAWASLGWNHVAFAEIEKFPSAVLAEHYPDVPNWGDLNASDGWPDRSIDLLVGGTPCQPFSTAGLRKGLDDPRGQLLFRYLALVRRYRPTWMLWENVPGVLHSDDGRAFGALLGALEELGYGFAWRVLDCQWFGLAQRRERLFVVGYAGADPRPAAAVLFEPEGLRGDSPPCRRSSKDVAGAVTTRSRISGEEAAAGHIIAAPEVAGPVTTRSVESNGREAIEGGHIFAFGSKDSGADLAIDIAPTLRARGHSTSHANAGVPPAVTDPGLDVRRLTPRECERLQGFLDDYTRIPWRGKPVEQCPDGPRYKAIGNSIPVPVLAWIGRRIALCEEVLAA